jgi:hypothetical protein
MILSGLFFSVTFLYFSLDFLVGQLLKFPIYIYIYYIYIYIYIYIYYLLEYFKIVSHIILR